MIFTPRLKPGSDESFYINKNDNLSLLHFDCKKSLLTLVSKERSCEIYPPTAPVLDILSYPKFANLD